MIRLLTAAGLALSVLATILFGLRDGAWMPAILAGIAVSMSLLPEELPVILTVFPAIGAWRLSRVQMLTRRLAAIEALGSISVLCVDKTGTITQNRMRVEHMHANGILIQVQGGNNCRLLSSNWRASRRWQASHGLSIQWKWLSMTWPAISSGVIRYANIH
jgi:magnesium-transporting ATPase (P-type)